MLLLGRGVAQLVARLLWEQEVPGSNPGAPTQQQRGRQTFGDRSPVHPPHNGRMPDCSVSGKSGRPEFFSGPGSAPLRRWRARQDVVAGNPGAPTQ